MIYDKINNTQAAGNAKPSLTATLLEEAYTNAKDQKISEDEEELIKTIAADIYVAGSDTVNYPSAIRRLLNDYSVLDSFYRVYLHPRDGSLSRSSVNRSKGTRCSHWTEPLAIL